MADGIPKKPRIRALLSLRRQIEDTRDLLIAAQNDLYDVERRQQQIRLRLGEALACVEVIVQLYNHLALEGDRQKGDYP